MDAYTVTKECQTLGHYIMMVIGNLFSELAHMV